MTQENSKDSPDFDSKDKELLLDCVQKPSRVYFEECVPEKPTRTKSMPKEYLDKDILSQDSTDQDCSTHTQSNIDDLLSPEEKFKADLQKEFMDCQLKDNAASESREFATDDPYETHLMDTLKSQEFGSLGGGTRER